MQQQALPPQPDALHPSIQAQLEKRDQLDELLQAIISDTPIDDCRRLPGWGLIESPHVEGLIDRKAMLVDFVRFTLIQTLVLAMEAIQAHAPLGIDTQHLQQIHHILTSTSMKNEASLLAEALLLGNKLEKIARGDIKILAVVKQGRDALYLQTKDKGRQVAHEAKSVTQAQAGPVDKAIMEAEGQHRMRLYQEAMFMYEEDAAPDERVWHKTTIVVGDPSNPWPASEADDRDALFDPNHRDALIRAARYRIRRLTLGALKVGKEDAQSVVAKREEADTSGRSVRALGDRATLIDDYLGNASKQQFELIQPGLPLSDCDNAHGKSFKHTRASKTADELHREHRRAAPTERTLAVTERIRVVIPHQNLCIVLDRTKGGYFIGHVKTMTGKAPEYRGAKPHQRQPRRPWHTDDPAQVRTGELLSQYGLFGGGAAASAGPMSAPKRKFPPLIAAKENNFPLTQSMIDFDPTEVDEDGRNVLHYAVLHQNEEMVRFLCSNQHIDDLINEDDALGNTPLHYAHSWGNPVVIALLMENHADATIKNNTQIQATDIEVGDLAAETDALKGMRMDFKP